MGDQPDGDRLNPPGTQPFLDLFPQERAYLVSDQPVKYPSGLLGIHHICVDLPRMLNGFRHGVVSDLVGYKADFLDFVGLPEAAAVFHQFVEAIQAAEGRGEFVELIDAALSYANRFHMWVDAVFPWGIANGFQRPKSTEELKTP